MQRDMKETRRRMDSKTSRNALLVFLYILLLCLFSETEGIETTGRREGQYLFSCFYFLL